MRLTKMHGCGNDYLLAVGPAGLDPEEIRAVCHRRLGVGADGVILLRPSERPDADLVMTISNADGTPGGMCGNGARCAARHAVESGLVPGPVVRLEAGRRIVKAELLEGDAVRLDMGRPALALADIPVDASDLDEIGSLGIEHQVAGLPAIFVSMGNPHMVSIVEEDLEDFDLGVLGPKIENYRAFPERMNLHLARMLAPDLVEARTWERGAGTTPACGTGACAVVVAAALAGRSNRFATVRMPGGDLLVEWDRESDHVFLTGPTARVGDVEWTPSAPIAAARPDGAG